MYKYLFFMLFSIAIGWHLNSYTQETIEEVKKTPIESVKGLYAKLKAWREEKRTGVHKPFVEPSITSEDYSGLYDDKYVEPVLEPTFDVSANIPTVTKVDPIKAIEDYNRAHPEDNIYTTEETGETEEDGNYSDIEEDDTKIGKAKKKLRSLKDKFDKCGWKLCK